ncbi:MAG TPA: HEPN domain-containing protein [Rhizomicrobium sp.]
MKPEARAFLDKSHKSLEKADGMLARWPDEAGRAAYLAGLHAAQAFIIEKTGQLAKTHKGVQRELALLTKDEREFGLEARAFLGRAYNMKALADYETGPGSKVTDAQAREAIDAAHQFVAALSKLMGPEQD